MNFIDAKLLCLCYKYFLIKEDLTKSTIVDKLNAVLLIEEKYI